MCRRRGEPTQHHHCHYPGLSSAPMQPSWRGLGAPFAPGLAETLAVAGRERWGGYVDLSKEGKEMGEILIFFRILKSLWLLFPHVVCLPWQREEEERKVGARGRATPATEVTAPAHPLIKSWICPSCTNLFSRIYYLWHNHFL